MGVHPDGSSIKPEFDPNVLVSWYETITVINRVLTNMKYNVHLEDTQTKWYQYHLADMNTVGIMNQPPMITKTYVNGILKVIENNPNLVNR